MHIHADKENNNFLNKKLFDLMKKDVLIINTSRGEIINENDLLNFLKKNKKSKYAADVIGNEIKKKWNSSLIKELKKNNNQILITPHLGGMTEEAQFIAYNAVVDDLIKKNEIS